MPYTALPDRRMPYDNDGTVVGYGTLGLGMTNVLTGSQKIQLQDTDYDEIAGIAAGGLAAWWFFPEQREVTAFYHVTTGQTTSGIDGAGSAQPTIVVAGSADSTNGLDGTWETASLPSGFNTYGLNVYQWRSEIKPVSFTGGKKVLRISMDARAGDNNEALAISHIYGEKVAGQTPDDLIFIDHDTTPGAEFTACEDFGDRPLATTVTRQFRVKNASSTKTANSINLQCNDTDFIISEDNSTWVVTINIASLAAGAESATLYVRNTTPAAGNLLGPRFARIVAIVGSWT